MYMATDDQWAAMSTSAKPVLQHRVQRWAGVSDTAVRFDREVVNPMLDDRFLDYAVAVPPRTSTQVCSSASQPLSRFQPQLERT